MKAGFVGLVGLPNAGKSTLVNALVGERVGIVTKKPQTTRRRALGILNADDLQAVLVDAPGMVKAESGLNHFLEQELESVISESDVLLAVLNIDQESPDDLVTLVEKVAAAGKPWAMVATKADLPVNHRIPILRDRLQAYNVPWISGSAETAPEALREQIVAELKNLLPESQAPLYDPELYTTQTVRELVSEVIREKCFVHLHQEVPYGLAVSIKKFSEDEGPVVKIYADLVLAKENHKGILLGTGGAKIREIGTEARKEIETIMGRKVFLELYVVVKRNWYMQENFMREFGYVLPE